MRLNEVMNKDETIVSVILFAGENMEDDFRNIMDDMDYNMVDARETKVIVEGETYDGVVLTCKVKKEDEQEFAEMAQRRMEDVMGIDFEYEVFKDDPVKL